MTLIVSCDPGISGALCLFDTRTDTPQDIAPMPIFDKAVSKKTRKAVDENAVLTAMRIYESLGARQLFIEQVGGLPGQSAPAAFTFGQGYGAVRMAALACGLAIEPVPPATWKGALRVPKDKKAARARAGELLPAFTHYWPLVKDDGKAEAAMLGLYAARYLRGEISSGRRSGSARDVEAESLVRQARGAA